MIEIGIGLLIIAIGSFGQSSSYVPINKVRDWSWESFWLVQGIFAWLVFPYLGAMLAVPEGSTLLELWRSPGSLGAVIYGMLWGVGGLWDRASPWVHAPVSVRSSRLCSVERICLREPD